MKMVGGNFNLYYKHEQLTPYNVRMATYGTDENSGGLLPEVGDVISDFPGEMSTPIRVRVTAVEPLGTRGEAYQVTVATVEGGPDGTPKRGVA